MYSQHPHHPLRPQQQQQQQQQTHYPLDTNYNPPLYTNNGIVRHTGLPPPPPPHYIIPPEPTPNASETNTLPLSIPELADFASMMVYLMWHARRPSVMALHDLSKMITSTQQQTGDHQLGHSKETATIANRTSAAFKKFCKQVLTATQLSESVILLALKYIAMLLQYNPSIQGAEGSEYRLFTVALMLGNKFLDDNTFTNKTWSEVTGMKVRDLNVMELEFLDVLGFKLFVKNDEFERWKAALLLFRNQLLNADGHLLEEAFKGIVNVQQQQNQQQQYQLMLMLSKAQLPHFPTQPLNRPLTRVPLRIPVQPVWRQNVIPTPTTAATATTPSTEYYHPYINTATPATTVSSNGSNTYQSQLSQQQQQQQQQPMRPVVAYNNNANYYAATPPSMDGYYGNNRPQPIQTTQPSIRPNRYYTEPLNDYTSTDMYSRPTTATSTHDPNTYHSQTYMPPPQTAYNNTNRPYRRPNNTTSGPVPEDPLTAMESYQNHLK
ncbi:hypothetical protein G6F37_006562 [Rhizopus arrhizus]|nr:hypothetical protein G6F38_006226 [Rhizopus arrhizus]KAG1157590.1 hypothetical protein G6F37_006562 [Rhizopus arrhizus]